MSEKPDTPLSTKAAPEQINTRLFDLCRYMRSELREAGLITMSEWSFLLSECPLAQGDGSPSPRRLEDYDSIRMRLTTAEEINADLLRALEAAEEHYRASQEWGEFVMQGVENTAEWNAEYERRLAPAKAAKAIADELRLAALAKAKGNTP